MKRSISQQNIARELGVSQALVSLVLNGKRENISEDSYKRIWDFAVKKGYRPKGMRVGNEAVSLNVGFILRAGLRLHTQSNFFSHVQHGLHTALQERGFNSVFLGSEDVLKGDALELRLQQNNLFGAVILGEVDVTFAKKIKKYYNRIVAVSARYPGLCHSVTPNEQQSMELLVDHLTTLGHKEFAWIGGNKALKQNSLRRQALVDALQTHGLRLADNFAMDVLNGDRGAGYEAAKSILERCSRKNLPTAWICLNGLMARGAINYLTQKNLEIPEQMSVAAVDATRVCIEEHPYLTGANADPEKMGIKAAELLLQAEESVDSALMDIMVPSHLTVRESSGKLK